MMGQNYNEYNTINAQQTLTWAHDYGKHHVDAMIGHEFNWNRSYNLNYKTQSSIIPDFQAFKNFLALNGGSTFSGIGGDINEEALEGYFMRANYNYDNKYYVTASVRTDGSSKFRYNDKRWGVFWSVGGAWRLSGESWLAAASWLTDLKLRADYGEWVTRMVWTATRATNSGTMEPTDILTAVSTSFRQPSHWASETT